MKKLLLSMTLLASLSFFGCGSGEEKKQNDGVLPDTTHGVSASTDSTSKELAYICPCGGCPEVRESKPGSCPKCEMELVQEKK